MNTTSTSTLAVETEYLPPAMTDLGTVTEATLGHAGGNNADDTQYFSNWK
ncbi:hypothetical protein OG471_00750 [Streptomyces sp. NBC_01336]|nr:hypothetical protein OG471_00750 [Streptomyces sp. NBC_01336]